VALLTRESAEPADPVDVVGRQTRPWLIIAALAVVGTVVRVSQARQDLFADEMATYWVISTRSLDGVVRTVATTAEISPPLSFTLSWLTSRLGLSPELIRLPALIAGIGTLLLVYAVGTRTVGRRAALVATAMTTFSPFMIYYSAEARGYAVAMGLLLVSTLALLRAIDDGRRLWWVVYGAAVCLAAYTHYTVVFVLAVQFAWALWAYPRRWKPLVASTVAAGLLYLPWIPSVKGDIDSPTTKILSVLSPFTLESVKGYLGHWSVGYPYNIPRTGLRDMPGTVGLAMLGLGLAIGAFGLFTARRRLGRRLRAGRGRPLLVVGLALATPVGTALQSFTGDNVFSTRSLASSWPYAALCVGALVTAGKRPVRLAASALVVGSFVISTVLLFTDDFTRPKYDEVARFVDERTGGTGALIDISALTPGPLTNFDTEGSLPSIPVFRTTIPEQKEIPFAIGMRYPDLADVAARSIEAAEGGPIVVSVLQPAGQPIADAFLELLPDDYELTETREFPALWDIQVLVYERVD
jgi:hypothetical protein